MRFFDFKTNITVFGLMILFVGCTKMDMNISLKQWIKDEEAYRELDLRDMGNCDSIIGTYKKIKSVEFKSKLYGQLSDCFIDDPKNLKNILKKMLRLGYILKE